MLIFVFYLWRHLWQTFTTGANFLYNSSLSRNTRFPTSDQVFSQSLWKLVQMESTHLKTLKLQNFYKILGEKCETFNEVIFQSSWKQFQGNISRQHEQTTIKTSTLSAICIFSPILVGENFKPLAYWFSLNNSETIKAVTLAFCSIQQHFIRDIRDKFGIPNSPQSPDIGQNSGRSISNFRISLQSFIKENCHKSRISDDIDMKLGPVSKLKKRNKTSSKTFDQVSCRQTITSLSFFWFLANLGQSKCWILDT